MLVDTEWCGRPALLYVPDPGDEAVRQEVHARISAQLEVVDPDHTWFEVVDAPREVSA